MEPVFKDDKLNRQLAEKGYVVIPFLSADDIRQLRAYYDALPKSDAKGTHVTMFNPDEDYRTGIDKHIKQICEEKAKALFNNYRALYSNYMVKEPGPEGDFPVHQDWTYVDESKHQSIAIWSPLHEVNKDNGALQVVSGSHKFITEWRGPYVDFVFSEIANEIKQQYSEVVELKAGEALLWDHRLIHFSLPNKSNNPRVAITLIMVPEEAEVYHCYRNLELPGNKIEKYIVDTPFYMNYTISKKPQGVTLKETIDQPAVKYTLLQFDEQFKKANKKSVLNKLLSAIWQ
jgi:hypothetical protein